MKNEQEAIACQSVYLLHQWIETVFTRSPQHTSAVLTQLLESFHPAFTMVTTGGKSLGLEAVRQLFHDHRGGRSGLKITIDACEVLASTDSEVLCRYRETHYLDGQEQARWSVALIDVAQPLARWRFLQETAID